MYAAQEILSTIFLNRKRRIPMTEGRFQPTLGGAIDFKWWRSDTAEWIGGKEIRDRVPRWDDEASDDEWYELDREAEQLGQADPWLVVRTSAEYQPLIEHEALVWEFASLPFERSAYAEFAKRFGPLTRKDAGRLPDRLSFWVQEHSYLRYAVSLYQAIESRMTDDLESLGIRTRPAPGDASRTELVASASLVPNPSLACILEDVSAEYGPGPARSFHDRIASEAAYVLIEPDASTRRIAQMALATIITGSLGHHTVNLLLDPDVTPLRMGLTMSFGVHDLIGAMWLQLALAADGNKTFRSCPVCGAWWNASGARSHKTVCSNRCRAKQSYERRKTAEEAAARDESS